MLGQLGPIDKDKYYKDINRSIMVDNEIEVTCCFCGQSLLFDKAIEITIKIDKQTDELQAVYAHSECIDSALHKSVPRGFDIE